MKPIHALRRRITYANVVATLALILALGGTSYAAFKLPRNTVGKTQLKHNAVTARAIARGAVGTSELSTKAKSTLAGAQGAQGAQGPQGAQGGQGPQGPQGPAASGSTHW